MRSIIFRVVIPIAVLAGVPLVINSVSANANHNDDSKSDVRTASIPGLSQTLESKFSVLKVKRSHLDRPIVGSGLSADVDKDFARSSGMNFNLAKRLSSEERIFAVPANGMICLVGQGAGSCTPERFADRDFQVTTGGKLPPKFVGVEGLVRDGITSAQINMKGGNEITITPTNNYLSTKFEVNTAEDLPLSIELKDSNGGTERFPLSKVGMEQLNRK